MRNAQPPPVAETAGAPLNARTIVPPEGGDWWDLLPEAAKEIAQQLVDRDAETNGAVLSLIDEKNAEHAVLRDTDMRIRGLRQPPHRLEDDDPRLAPGLIHRDRIRERIERLADRIRKLTDDKNGLLIDQLKKYVLAHAGRIAPHPEPVDVGEIAGGEEMIALTRIRETIAEIRADQHAALSAPRPRSEVLEAARLQIAQLAERGKPNVDFISEQGRINWPQRQTHSEVNCRIGDAIGGGIAIGAADDTLAILCWALKSQIDRAFELLISDEIDDVDSLTDNARAARLDQLAVDLLATERTEIAIVETATARGLSVKYRHDTDPRAILHVI